MDATFPLLGSLCVVACVLPCAALVAKGASVLLERTSSAKILHGLALRFVVLFAASVAPLWWFVSAALHQSERATGSLVCTSRPHASGAEAALFAALLIGYFIVRTSWVWWRSTRGASASSAPVVVEQRSRIDALVAAQRALPAMRGRLLVVEDATVPIATIGWFRPRVVIAATFAQRLSDSMLLAALAHEFEHVEAWDPLRYAALEVALSLNPIARKLLAPHVARWRAAREAHCDREAVVRGVDPLALAQAIVYAARPASSTVAALGVDRRDVIEFRVELLMAFSERSPSRCCQKRSDSVSLAALVTAVVLFLPHHGDSVALDALHATVERAAALAHR